MADPAAAAKALRAEEQKAVEKSLADYKERTKGRPTPTQEECDLAKLGAPVEHKQESGAGPDPRATRQMESGAGGAYQTRTAAAKEPRST
jgi:hypothetical protein